MRRTTKQMISKGFSRERQSNSRKGLFFFIKSLLMVIKVDKRIDVIKHKSKQNNTIQYNTIQYILILNRI